jgi:integrin beta 3
MAPPMGPPPRSGEPPLRSGGRDDLPDLDDTPRSGRGGARVGLQAGMGAIRGARSELRKQMREQQRLRMLTLVAVVVTVLGALPLFLLVQAATRDPVFTSLDALNVPGWAASAHSDEVGGSQWCVLECRYRERDVQSQKTPDETNTVYVAALQEAGWQRWRVADCPSQSADQKIEGHYTCWRKDEYTLDLWVRGKPCTDELLRNRPTGAADAAGASAAPGTDCSGSLVSFKVYNAVADARLNQPSGQPSSTSPDTGDAGQPTPTP